MFFLLAYVLGPFVAAEDRPAFRWPDRSRAARSDRQHDSRDQPPSRRAIRAAASQGPWGQGARGSTTPHTPGHAPPRPPSISRRTPRPLGGANDEAAEVHSDPRALSREHQWTLAVPSATVGPGRQPRREGRCRSPPSRVRNRLAGRSVPGVVKPVDQRNCLERQLQRATPERTLARSSPRLVSHRAHGERQPREHPDTPRYLAGRKSGFRGVGSRMEELRERLKANLAQATLAMEAAAADPFPVTASGYVREHPGWAVASRCDDAAGRSRGSCGLLGRSCRRMLRTRLPSWWPAGRWREAPTACLSEREGVTVERCMRLRLRVRVSIPPE